jgi:WD40 repeat protein
MRVLNVGKSLAGYALAYSQDSASLAVSIRTNYLTREVRLWDLTRDEPVRHLKFRSADCQPRFTFDELVTGKRETVPKFKVIRLANHRSFRAGVCRAVASPVYGFLVRYFDSGYNWTKPLTYRIWVIDRGNPRPHPSIEWVLARRSAASTKVALSADGSLAAMSAGHLIRVWRVENGNELATVKYRTSLPGGFAFSADGRYLGVLFQDSVSLYDTTSWTVAKTYSWKVGKLLSLAFSPDGATAAVGSDKGKVVVFDLE